MLSAESNADSDGGPQRNSGYAGAEVELLLHISKELLTNSINYVCGMSQVLQGLSGLLLTIYITVGLATLEEGYGIAEIPILISALPAIFFVASLMSNFILAYQSPEEPLPLGDLETGIEIFERMVFTRRKQGLWPTVLTGLGLVTMILIFYWAVYYNVT